MEYQYVWAYIDHVKRSCEDESTQTSCMISGVCGRCDVAKVDVEGVLTCPSCGTVDAMSIDEKPEWVSSVNELGVYAADNSSRCDFKRTRTRSCSSVNSGARARRYERNGRHRSPTSGCRRSTFVSRRITEIARSTTRMLRSTRRQRRFLIRCGFTPSSSTKDSPSSS